MQLQSTNHSYITMENVRQACFVLPCHCRVPDECSYYVAYLIYSLPSALD